MASKSGKHKPTGSYPVGYSKPPKHSQFKPGQSGNPKGKPKGLPSTGQLLLEESARMVKVKIGDEIVHIPKQRALMRKMIDLGLQGDVGAIRLVLTHLALAHMESDLAPPPELPLTDEELAVLKLAFKKGLKK